MRLRMTKNAMELNTANQLFGQLGRRIASHGQFELLRGMQMS